MSSARLAERGVHIEPDGTIVLERAQIAPAAAPEVHQADHVLYHVANPALMASFENPGQIQAYRAFAAGPILEPDAWRLALAADGQALAGHPPHTEVRGQMMVESWLAPGCRVIVTSFCDSERNVIYQSYGVESLDGRPHALEIAIRASFLADEDQSTYALHFDEKHEAIVAVLGEMVLPAPGERESRIVPARAALIGADLAPAEWEVSGKRAYLTYRLEAPPGEERAFCLAVTGGHGRAEHELLFEHATREWRQRLAEVRRRGDWLAGRLEVSDVSLHGLFTAGLSCAQSAYHEDREGRFKGLLPSGDAELEPIATLPCDAYWSSQVLLPFHPEMVREEILTLARAVHDDGQLARGVRIEPRGGSLDWGAPACDSPSYFAMLLHDYLAWTDDREILDVREGGRSVWEKAQACVNYLRSLDTNHDLLFEKRRDQPDWQADVLRDDWVTYDLALHFQALKCVAQIAILRGEEETGRDYADWAARAQKPINARLWREPQGYYVDYVRSYMGFVEDHAAADTVVAALYGLGSESQVHRHLAHLTHRLETRANDQQYYGDWGVMDCFPFYRDRADLLGRSAQAYSYHNGGAWPGWSGAIALAHMLHHQEGWRYPLERWWTYGLEQYWFTPTEWYSPSYSAPGLRQSAALYAWSALPAAAMVLGGFGFWPNLAGEVVLRVPPWGSSRLNGVRLRGATYDVEAHDGVVTVYQNGHRLTESAHGLRIRLGRVAVSL